jgi:hypothetical protein
MKAKITAWVCFILLTILVAVPTIPVFAAYSYYMPVTIFNNSATTYYNLSVLMTMNNTQLVSLGYLSATGLDSDIQESGSSFNISMSNAYTGFVLPAISPGQSRQLNYYLGNTPARNRFSILTGRGGYVNITDTAALELLFRVFRYC